MKPLLILLGVFFIALIVMKPVRGSYDGALAGRIAMAAMLVFTAIGHFVYTKGMALMLPEAIPFRTAIVYLTGVLEIAAAIGLFIPNLKIIAAWLLIVFFILVLPANIYAAIKQLDYQKATFDGNGLMYLVFRIPLQLLFIAWIYLSAIK